MTDDKLTAIDMLRMCVDPDINTSTPDMADLLEEVEALETERDALKARVAAAVCALTPSGATKGAYIAEFHHHVRVFDEYGEEHHLKTEVPWTTIKEIMAAIRLRAGLPEGAND